MSSLISELRTGSSNNLGEFAYYKEILKDMEDRVIKSAATPLTTRQTLLEVHRMATEMFNDIKAQREALGQDIALLSNEKNFYVRVEGNSPRVQNIDRELLLKQDRTKGLEDVKAEFEELIAGVVEIAEVYFKPAVNVDDPD